jgi:hypothetical protein
VHFGKKNDRQEFTMGGHTLESSKWEKDLGVFIEYNLKLSFQFAKAASKRKHGLGPDDQRLHMEGP